MHLYTYIHVSTYSLIHPYTSSYTHTLINPYTHNYTPIHPYTYALIHPCIHSYTINKCTHPQIHPSTNTPIHKYTHLQIHPSTSTLIHLYTHTPVHPYNHTSIHAYTHTFIHPQMHIHPSIPPPIHSAAISTHTLTYTFIRHYTHTLYTHTAIPIHSYTPTQHMRIHPYHGHSENFSNGCKLKKTPHKEKKTPLPHHEEYLFPDFPKCGGKRLLLPYLASANNTYSHIHVYLPSQLFAFYRIKSWFTSSSFSLLHISLINNLPK